MTYYAARVKEDVTRRQCPPNITTSALAGLGITLTTADSFGGYVPTPQYSHGPPLAVAVPLRIPATVYHSETQYPPPYLPVQQQNYLSVATAYSPSFVIEDATRSLSHMVLDPADAYSADPTSEFSTNLALIPSTSADSTLDARANALLNKQKDTTSDAPTSRIVSPDPGPPSSDEPMIGLFADVNFRQLSYEQQSPTVGINPALLMGDMDVKMEDAEANLASDEADSEIEYRFSPSPPPDNFDDAVNAVMTVLAASINKQSPKMPVCSPAPLAAPAPVVCIAPPLLQLDHPMSPERLSFPTRSAKTEALTRLLPSPPLRDISNLVDYGLPVRNAHLGIELEDLRRKASEFRTLNAGRDIDKEWLASYAGRLSQRGELLSEYRCYVNGCTQYNKRRDHILVHVGSHVEYRPFECEDCGMRFLRKNECKRHASSHKGIKPYSCQICAPTRDRSFVRQDLLKRHMKVTHGIQGRSQQDRKRIKLEENGAGALMIVGSSGSALQG
ncbi:hypothetical protein K474DRAFT_1671597 [Panus rudis PR-1116 ss-1]|nr:hypothetical protein K474DRAFT_1671597 [Panus rudis PR-1116 ss-1]